LAGVSRLQYTSDIRIVRLMCTGRVDLAFILRALANGNDGVFVGGCWLGECHYLTEGNYDALSMMHIAKRILAHIGVSPERLRLEWLASSEGIRYAEVMIDFSAQVKALGPLGEGEGIDADVLKFKLDAVVKLIPYIKLVERERLRVPVKKESAYATFFAGEEFATLFDELIGVKLTLGQIISLLGDGPHSTGELSERLGVEASEVAKQINGASRQGLVRYD
jgi:F420-non-reducing hydrogenase iron-sulfur subunit